ncbi:cell division protein FtsW [Zobellella denitrificans]|jgi:cell division protein FtsW|uniref:Probable peptidoglycan glycosyltransferase FtsW n=1 Tax=Zobellella denitrificans TaxID=347534 RepID=A0A231MZY8_9GAMM|nr:cell division protein FtsW [Zobellella denitrificans]ATG75218.1 cell division protein FtsW [Zobellella denitrificans]OXS15794.1 cell division protein FtsW [Zobellella denitrificans]
MKLLPSFGTDWLLRPSQGLVYDRQLVVLALSLMAIGLVMVSSASIAEGINVGNDPFYFVKRHGAFLLICLMLASLMLQVPMARWQQFNASFLILALLLLVAVLLLGRNINGSTRWLALGPINVQPAEIAKLALFTFLAGYLVRKQEEVRGQWRGFLKPLAVMGVMSVLLLMQPDLGSVVVLFVTTIGMLFLAGARLSQFVSLIVLGVGLVGFLIITSPYRMRRVTSFLNPWEDPFGSGYQLTQSLMAFGRGGWFGEGLGNSIQKLEYLPEAHTDFVFAILGEELGFSGVLLVLLLQAWLAFKALHIGQKVLMGGRQYEGYLAMGIGIWFSFQTVVNVGAASGLLPTKGLTLPLVSYGGSSLLVISTAVAILVRIDFEWRRDNMQARQREVA